MPDNANVFSLQAPVKIAVIFKQLRVLIESVLKKKLENPKMSLEGNFIAALLALLFVKWTLWQI